MKLSLIWITSLAILFCITSTGIFFYSQGKKEVAPTEQKNNTQIKPDQPPTGGSPSHIFEIRDTENTQTAITPSTIPQESIQTTTQTPQEELKKENSTQQALHTYANTVGLEIGNLSVTLQANQEIFVALATSTPPQNLSDSVTKLADAYQNTALNIDKITTPAETITYHTELVTSYKNTSLALRDLAEAVQKNTTPVTAMQTYNISVASSTEALIGIAHVIKKEQVMINSTESGYFFLQIIP